MRLILLGAPGSGKGTQAQFIINEFDIPPISTGEILRTAVNEETPIGKKVETLLTQGVLVPDELVINLVRKHITQQKNQSGFLLDGFPRTIPQAKALQQANINISHVVELRVDDNTIIERITGRRIHPKSGRVYHIKYNPPKVEAQDDITQEPLIQRNDDNEETIRQRLKIYHQQTSPLIQFYQNDQTVKFTSISATGDVNNIRDKIFAFLP